MQKELVHVYYSMSYLISI
uniref:Uncharacterized protein n=1 Tax=Anguilla anguilla TaxID=7936 RepID=A0A0E9QH98_ANGAN